MNYIRFNVLINYKKSRNYKLGGFYLWQKLAKRQ